MHRITSPAHMGNGAAFKVAASQFIRQLGRIYQRSIGARPRLGAEHRLTTRLIRVTLDILCAAGMARRRHATRQCAAERDGNPAVSFLACVFPGIRTAGTAEKERLVQWESYGGFG